MNKDTFCFFVRPVVYYWYYRKQKYKSRPLGIEEFAKRLEYGPEGIFSNSHCSYSNVWLS